MNENKGTLLTGAISPEEWAKIEKQRAREEEAVEIASLILANLYEGYKGGEITFIKYCQMALDVFSVENIPGYERQKKFGMAVETALKLGNVNRSANSTRSHTKWLQQLCYDLVELAVKREGLPKTRVSKKVKTAFERAADILAMRGIQGFTSNSVEKAWASRSKTIRRKSK